MKEYQGITKEQLRIALKFSDTSIPAREEMKRQWLEGNGDLSVFEELDREYPNTRHQEFMEWHMAELDRKLSDRKVYVPRRGSPANINKLIFVIISLVFAYFLSYI